MSSRNLIGFTLVEVLIASFIIASLVLTFYGISSAVATNVSLANQRATAAKFAVEGLERVEAYRNEAQKNSRSVSGSTVAAADAWDSYLTGGSTADTIQLGRISTNLSNVRYDRDVTLTRGTGVDLPRVGYRDDSGNWQTLTVSDYKGDYWKVTVNVSWPGPVSTLNYTLVSYITNWKQVGAKQ